MRPVIRSPVECWSTCAVDGGERAVMYDRIQGVLPKAVTEGTHFRVPWLQNPAVMDIRTRPRSISSVTGTKGSCTLDQFSLCDPQPEHSCTAWFQHRAQTLHHVMLYADLQMVNITLRVLSKPDVESLSTIYKVST